MRRSQSRRPTLAQITKIRIRRLDPRLHFEVELVTADHRNVDRRAHAEIGFQRRIHRDQADFQRIVEIAVKGDGAIEDGLSIFVFADLKKGRVRRAFDEIAGRIDHEEPGPFGGNLAADEKGDVKGDAGLLVSVGIEAADVTQARPTSCAAAYIVSTPSSFSSVSPAGSPSETRLITPCVAERLPAVAIAIAQRPGLWKACSLRKVEILSSPALVRVSAIITNPSRTKIPQQ
jgi:hypothetical protein